ncbi:MAG: STAS domain-containing protein [bacterium]
MFKIESNKENNITFITIAGLKGMFEIEHAGLLEQQVNKNIEKNQKDIAIDFSSVEIMNSASISRLIVLIKTIQAVNGRIVFWGLHQELLDILNFVNIPNFALANSKEGAKDLFL